MKDDLLKLINVIDNNIYVNTYGSYAEGYTDALSIITQALQDIIEQDFDPYEWETIISKQIEPYAK